MKKITKLLALLLVLVMAIGMLSACGKKTEEKKEETTKTETQDKTETKEEAKDEEPAGEEPVVEEEKPFFPLAETAELSVWTVDNQTMTPGYADTPTAALLKEYTNVDLQVAWVTSNEAAEKFGLMIASGDIPDFINNISYYTGGSMQACYDGVSLETTDLVQQYMPNYAAILEANPSLRKDITADDGKMYSIYGVQVDSKNKELLGGTYVMGVTIRRDFLEKAGLEMPTTIDEWTNALRAFKEMGVENPLRTPGTGVMTSSGHFITAYGILPEFYQENGTVKYGPAEQGYKDFLDQMAAWYAEGLLDQNFTSYGGMLDLGDMADGNTGAGTIWWQFGGAELAFMGFDVPAELFWENAPHPTLNKGDVAYSSATTSSLDTELVLNAELKGDKLELACRYLDFLYTDEAFYAMNYGVEGEHYYIDENGEVQFTDMMHNDEVHNVVQMNINTSNAPFAVGKKAGDKANAYYPEGNASVDMNPVWKAASDEKVIPSRATMLEEELLAYNTTYTNIKTLVDEFTVNYIMGSPSMDFETFVDTLYSYGLEECMGYKQAALDRYNAR